MVLEQVMTLLVGTAFGVDVVLFTGKPRQHFASPSFAYGWDSVQTISLPYLQEAEAELVQAPSGLFAGAIEDPSVPEISEISTISSILATAMKEVPRTMAIVPVASSSDARVVESPAVPFQVAGKASARARKPRASRSVPNSPVA